MRSACAAKHSKAAEKKLLEKRITISECEGKIGRLDGLPRPKAREKEQLAKAASQLPTCKIRIPLNSRREK